MVRTGAKTASIPTIDQPDKLTWPRYIKVMPTTIAAKASSTTNTLTENDDREEDGKKRVMLPSGSAIFRPVKQ